MFTRNQKGALWPKSLLQKNTITLTNHLRSSSKILSLNATKKKEKETNIHTEERLDDNEEAMVDLNVETEDPEMDGSNGRSGR